MVEQNITTSEKVLTEFSSPVTWGQILREALCFFLGKVKPVAERFKELK